MGVSPLFLLGFQKIKTTWRLADDWREFQVTWRHDAWSELLVKELWESVKLKGFSRLWINRRHNNSVITAEKGFGLTTVPLFVSNYDTFEYKCVDMSDYVNKREE